ncbi:hypothetical protein GCM10010372_76060 [Streptomyces tauricus]|nr:hypothetical protein GCM10010372_76060 [Streptomyces tauricus]
MSCSPRRCNDGGFRGLVITAGVRDTSELRQMQFPVWSAAINAQGPAKATAGSVNVPIVVGGAVVRPGDVVLAADEDGVLVVPRERVGDALAASEAREAKEALARVAFRDGQLGLVRYGLRSVLADQGVDYVMWEDQQDR